MGYSFTSSTTQQTQVECQCGGELDVHNNPHPTHKQRVIELMSFDFETSQSKAIDRQSLFHQSNQGFSFVSTQANGESLDNSSWNMIDSSASNRSVPHPSRGLLDCMQSASLIDSLFSRRFAEFDGLNALQATHTWGQDLSGSMQGAGGVGGLLSTTNAVNNTTAYPTYDANGNITEYLDQSGSVVAHYQYDEFGKTLTKTGSKADDFNFRFSTKLLDDESGHYYYGYRYYQPTTGKWLSRDPIGESGGLNIYGFVVNDGINLYDILGLTCPQGQCCENGSCVDCCNCPGCDSEEAEVRAATSAKASAQIQVNTAQSKVSNAITELTKARVKVAVNTAGVAAATVQLASAITASIAACGSGNPFLCAAAVAWVAISIALLDSAVASLANAIAAEKAASQNLKSAKTLLRSAQRNFEAASGRLFQAQKALQACYRKEQKCLKACS